MSPVRGMTGQFGNASEALSFWGARWVTLRPVEVGCGPKEILKRFLSDVLDAGETHMPHLVTHSLEKPEGIVEFPASPEAEVDMLAEGLDVAEGPIHLVDGLRPLERLFGIRDGLQNEVPQSLHDLLLPSFQALDILVHRLGFHPRSS